MEPKKSFVFYLSWRSAINLLNDSQKAELLNAIFDYVSGEPIFINDGGVNICFEFIKSDIERDLEKWKNIKNKRSEAGKKGGRPPKENEFEKQTKAKKAVNVNVDVNVDNNNIILTDNSTDNKQNNIIEKKEIKNISKYNSTSNNDIFLISKKEEEKEKDWRKDFNVYLSELHEEVDKILCDAEWMEKQKEFNPPELNIIKTIECAIENFWGTTEGWENKKKSKTKKINWKTTLAKALKIQTNRVFYPKNLAGGARGFAKKETMEEQTQRVAFKIMQDIQEGKDDSLFGMMYNKKDNK
jgi:hypothetical protein